MGTLTLHRKTNDDGYSVMDFSGRNEIVEGDSIMMSNPILLTGMSHEVRTLMNAIVAFSFLMNRNDCNGDERNDYSRQILSSCEQLIGLFDNFLDSAIIETGNSKTELVVCKLPNILEDLLSEFREIINKENLKDVVLVSETGFNMPEEVFIDANRVFRVIRNLFQNALKNTRTGYIKVGYYFRGDKVTFYILDSGQGFFKSKEFLVGGDISQSLSKYNDTTSAINLFLARKIVEMLGGSIWIESNGIAGTGIFFSVPVKVAENADNTINNFVSNMIAI